MAAKGSKNVYQVESSKPKHRISAMYTFSADGSSYRPQLIFKKDLRKIPKIRETLEEIGADIHVSQSGKGYQTQETFEEYAKKSFLEEIDERGIRRDAGNPVF